MQVAEATTSGVHIANLYSQHSTQFRVQDIWQSIGRSKYETYTSFNASMHLFDSSIPGQHQHTEQGCLQ